MGSTPRRTAVWYAVAREEPMGSWTLRVSMTLDADGGAREDRHPPTIDDACELLRLWSGRLTTSEP